MKRMRLMKRIPIRLFFLLLCWHSAGLAQEFEFYPNARYDSAIPTLQQVSGHAWGEKITTHAEMQAYLRALADASPNVVLATYGTTWEGRTLYYLIIASEQNLARIEAIKTGMQQLADPRRLSGADADRLIASLPSITWLAYGVHGNEISSTDAGLLTAYHLVAAQNDTLSQLVLQNSVVIIDPLQNPDGRDRFINYFRQTRGRWPDADPQAAEHRETWPGGRTNHYLFDMNRDWFALTQPETRGRVQAFLEWYPQVFVDLHEMGSNSTYYFAPPADPYNPEMPPPQIEWLQRYGQNNAKWFDRMRFDYFTREVFDSFYPGYGEGWPMFHGSVGMTYEQASTRGLVVERDDETTMHYRETVRQHFIASLSTAETTARHRRAVLRYFYDYRKSAIDEGQAEKVREFIIAPGRDPNRATRLAALLQQQGIEVKRASASFRNGRVEDYYGSGVQSKSFPAGSYVVSLAQPAKRLAKTLLIKQVEMDRAFVEEQLRRQKKRIDHQIYDVTAWSLPLLHDVDAYMAHEASSGNFEIFAPATTTTPRISGEAHLAYLIPWGSHAAARALAELQRRDFRVFSTDKEFTLDGRRYPRGTLIVKVKDNPADLHTRLRELSVAENLEIVPTNSAWVEEGANFGSGEVQFLKKPKVALAYNTPVSSYSAGWTRYLVEQVYGYPVTILHAEQLGRLDLSKYNVLILPDSWGGYGNALGDRERVKEWVQRGGTLITFGAATHWLTGEKVGLLSTTRELKGGMPDKPKPDEKKKEAEQEKKPDLSQPFELEKEIQPEKELPIATPGAIMRVVLDNEHWLAFGYGTHTNVLVDSRNIFTPLKLDKGRNVAVYEAEAKLVLSGFVWEESKKQLASKSYLMHEPHGRGHVVAFAEDPATRAFCDGLHLLLLNAIFLGPAH